MRTAVNYKKQINDLTKELTEEKIQQLIAFGQFLKAKQAGFSYTQISDSAEYVRELRSKESKRSRSAKNFIQELMEWQKSDS
ncbi:hypothetical protein [Desulfobacterium sp. N47]|uniref:Uncharacterized protein n=1 Tax=uncultured Desulfobacterium sp. TaxID=201089 RepID=E1YK64_9BACT|nr:unknown protein [uncultured Desulfobacterium sp.]